jgi:hypothetical protein
VLPGALPPLQRLSSAELCAAGSNYEINLLKAPFKTSKPLEVLSEQTPDGKHLLLFEVATMTWDDPLHGLLV